MPTGQGLTGMRSLTFWGSRFDHGKLTDGKESPSVVSVQPSRRMRGRKSGMRSGDGSCIAVRGSPSQILAGRSIPNFGHGSTTMGALRLRRSGPSSGMSANRWFAGLVGNTRSYAITGVEHGPGCWRFSIVSRICLPFGSTSVVGYSPQELYEWRRSRTVLGGPRGAIPGLLDTMPYNLTRRHFFQKTTAGAAALQVNAAQTAQQAGKKPVPADELPGAELKRKLKVVF